MTHQGQREDRKLHGRCHRCGWVQDVTPVSRHTAKELGMGRHAAHLCAECIADLRRDTSARTAVQGATPRVATDHRSRVVA